MDRILQLYVCVMSNKVFGDKEIILTWIVSGQHFW